MTTSFARRSLTVAVAATLALSTAGCNRGSDSGAGGEGGQPTMTLAVSTLNNPFFVQLKDGAEAAAEEAGAQLEVFDAQNDASTQQNQLANASTQGVDAVLINPVDSEAAGAAVAPVIDADIPVIAVDRTVEGAEVTTLVSSDNVAGGVQAADALAAAIGEKGTVVVLQGVAGTSASRERGEGFTQGIEEYPDIEVVAAQPANFDRTEALNVTTNLLQSHPDAVGIFAENDEMALGAVQALGDRAGADVSVVGFDGTDGGLEAVEAGTLSATVAQQPSELGRVAVEKALEAIDGAELDAETSVAVTTVDESNVADFAP